MNRLTIRLILLPIITLLVLAQSGYAQTWNGLWMKDKTNILTITKESKKGFHFAFVSNNVKDIEGDATLNNGVGIYKKDKSEMKFQLAVDTSFVQVSFIAKNGKPVVINYKMSYEDFFKRLNKDTEAPTKPQENKPENTSKTDQSSVSTGSWNGEWKLNKNYKLIISNETKTSFQFKFDCYNGGNVGQAEGTAKINGNSAIYKESNNCPIKFLNRGDIIGVTVEQEYNSDCFLDAGNGIRYDGDYKSPNYKKEKKEKPNTSTENSIESFWKEFQTAVVNGDKNKVAEMTLFPIEGVELNKEQFIANFSKYFNKKVVEKIKKSTIKNLKEDNYYASDNAKLEKSFFLQLDFGAGTENAYNWSYVFVIRDGTFKLIKIEFAG